jgi:hypothetical protein
MNLCIAGVHPNIMPAVLHWNMCRHSCMSTCLAVTRNDLWHLWGWQAGLALLVTSNQSSARHTTHTPTHLYAQKTIAGKLPRALQQTICKCPKATNTPIRSVTTAVGVVHCDQASRRLLPHYYHAICLIHDRFCRSGIPATLIHTMG